MDGFPCVQALGDIQIAVKAMQEEEESLEHPVDKHYKTLHCALTPLDHEHPDFKVHLLTCSLSNFTSWSQVILTYWYMYLLFLQ